MTYSTVEEATLKALAVMTKADTNIQEVEVELVQKILKEELGLEITTAKIRVAAHDEFIEDRPIEKYLKKVQAKLSFEDKQHIARSLVKVMHVDGHHSEWESDLFDKIVEALKLRPSDIACL